MKAMLFHTSSISARAWHLTHYHSVYYDISLAQKYARDIGQKIDNQHSSCHGLLDNTKYIQFVIEHEKDDPERLLLSAARWPEIDVRRAARNIGARAKIRTKIPSWYVHPELEYPGSLPLEQASSEATALYKQAFVPEGARIADLTGGLGVDCWFMSRNASEAHYCERQGELCTAARNNFSALSDTCIAVARDDGESQRRDVSRECTPITVHEGDGIDWLAQQAEHFDLIYLDPARRDAAARRVYDIADCEPNLLEIKDILFEKATRVLAKISPMADISRTLSQFPEARELHVLAVAGEVKELLLLLETGEKAEPLIVAHDILHQSPNTPEEAEPATSHHFEFHPKEEPAAEVKYAEQIGKYLYQPSKAVLKAGAFRLLSERYNLEKLAPSTHLYTADSRHEGFPGKCFEVESVLEWNKASLRQLKQTYEKLEMTALNFPLATDALREKLGIAGGGTHHLFATTLCDKRKVLITCAGL